MKIRHLNKIIFIKSADVDYLEISLDGNVHFTGDQGVGKSTILRAILFFYNARTEKLGINLGDDNFLEFYFQYSNSHIIYEIETEYNKFIVWLTKEGNRPAYRFVDTEFQKELFFENTTKGYRPLQVEEVKHNLRENSISLSRKIFLFNDFRDIIYGANKDIKYRPYAIMRSPAYQNIPTTITNIFLNAQLNSDKIKQTIIQSLIGEEQNESKRKFQIDLMTIRKDLFEFEQDFNDISDYDNTKIKAKNVISIAEEYKKAEQKKIILSQYLGESYLFFQNEFIETEAEYKLIKPKLEFSNNEISELKENHLKAEKEIENKITISKNDIYKAQQKQQYWENIRTENDLIGIENILKRVAEEKRLRNDLNSKKSELQILKTKFESIDQKYTIQFHKIENDKNTSINTFNAQFSEFNNTIIEKKQKVNDFYSNKFSEVDEIFEKNTVTLYNQKDHFQEELSNLERKRDRINSQEFYKDDIENLKKEILNFDKKSNYNLNEISIFKSNIINIESKAESDKKLLEKEFQIEKEKLKQKFEIFENKIKKINQNLQSFENSFYKYLNENCEDWEQNIGKVCDERILFKDNLSPKLIKVINSFYGVEIDLSELDSNIKTIKEYENEKEELSFFLEDTKKRLKELNDGFDTDETNLNKAFKRKISTISKNITQCKNDNLQMESRKSKVEIRLSDLQQDAKEEKIKLIAEISPKINKAQSNIAEIKKTIDNQKTIKHNRKQNIDIERNKQIQELDKKLSIKEVELNENLNKNETDYKLNFQILKDKQLQELKGKGADTERIIEIEKIIEKIQTELAFIENLRNIYVNKYEVEKIEIDKISQLIESNQKNEIFLHELKNTNRKEIERVKAINKQLSEKLNQIEKNKGEIQKDIKEYEIFEKTDVFQQLAYYITRAENRVKHEKLAIIISKLKDIIIRINNISRKLRNQVEGFVSPFRENNIFNFPKRFPSESDCLNFAENLKEYIDEEKIEDVKKQVKKKHSSLIQYIVGDINLLASKRKDIEKIILDINRDFDKSNFVTVIQKFEMKIIDTANKIVQVLFQIKEFHDEHNYDYGEQNLFSSQKLDENNQKSIKLLTSLLANLRSNTKQTEINLEDIFELKFRAKQNNKDTGWKSKLSDVGSHGTDILLKAMIYIMLLNVFKEKASRKSKFKEFRLHCIMDEIGRIHSKNVKSLIEFANSRDIWMIFGSPEESEALAYKYVYDFEKQDSVTTATRLIYDKRN